MSNSGQDDVEALAQHLLREGNFDNEADARLAAILIVVARERASG